MAIVKQAPRVVHLAGKGELLNEHHAYEELTPGMLLERYLDGSTIKWKKQVTASIDVARIVCLDRPELNQDLDTVVPAGDIVNAFIPQRGATINAIIASGQNIANGEYLESAGGGKLQAYSAGVKLAQSLEAVNNTNGTGTVNAAGDARIKVEFL